MQGLKGVRVLAAAEEVWDTPGIQFLLGNLDGVIVREEPVGVGQSSFVDVGRAKAASTVFLVPDERRALAFYRGLEGLFSMGAGTSSLGSVEENGRGFLGFEQEVSVEENKPVSGVQLIIAFALPTATSEGDDTSDGPRLVRFGNQIFAAASVLSLDEKIAATATRAGPGVEGGVEGTNGNIFDSWNKVGVYYLGLGSTTY